jgi:hypothetical protein
LDKWTIYFTSFSTKPSTSNSNSIWVGGEFLFKMDCIEELLYAATWLKLPKGWRAKKEVYFAHRILDFHFFSILLLLMVLHDIIFNVTTLLWMCSPLFFSRHFTSSIGWESGVKIPSTKKFSLTHTYKSKGRISAICAQLGSKVMCKRPKKEDHLIFMNFRVKRFIVKRSFQRKLWCLNSIIFWIPWNEGQ